MIAASKYEQMKKEVQEVAEIFLDDTKDSEQTVQLITEIAGAAIAVQGLSEIPDNSDKAKITGLMLLEIAVAELKSHIVDAGA